MSFTKQVKIVFLLRQQQQQQQQNKEHTHTRTKKKKQQQQKLCFTGGQTFQVGSDSVDFLKIIFILFHLFIYLSTFFLVTKLTLKTHKL